MLVRSTEAGRERARIVGENKIFRTFLIPSKYLINPLIEFLKKLLGMDRRFSDPVIAMYKRTFRQKFPSLEPDDVGSENYWLPALRTIARSNSHEKTLQTWLHLYGFARNASAAFYLSSSLIIGHLYFNPETHTTFTRVQLGIQFVLAATLGLRYWILYSHYYSKGVIRAFLESATYQADNNQSENGA